MINSRGHKIKASNYSFLLLEILVFWHKFLNTTQTWF